MNDALTTPKERPILFSAELVRAILAGRKTVTRRVVKLPCAHHDATYYAQSTSGESVFGISEPPGAEDHYVRSPYGKPGDELWVREAFRLPVGVNDLSPKECGRLAIGAGYPEPWAPTRYEAEGTVSESVYNLHGSGGKWGRLRPSIHMPRWASRIQLRVTEVSVERVQEITWADAVAEGCPGYRPTQDEPTHQFRRLWDSINEGRGYAWDANPWVWVVRFEVIG
ncbi:MAG: hypothetical protein Rubg2KO_15290 [Rubricoccaceae bacterium]